MFVCALVSEFGCGDYGVLRHFHFNSISYVSWWSVLLVEETGIPIEKH